MSTDPHNELRIHQDHYIGIDVGTGSARACIMNEHGDIIGLAAQNIGLWQPQGGYYVGKLTALSLSPWPKQNLGTIDNRYMALHLHVNQAGNGSACR
jgi:hypothetical protein